ncbi:MAG: RsmB/NOP family class I SAM-dependent RNA methyltransferase [Candidatus Dojkabacteria bacterium]
MTVDAKIENFKTKLQQLYPNDFQKIIKSLTLKNFYRGFRFTNLFKDKSGLEELSRLGIDYFSSGFLDSFLCCDKENRLSSTTLFRSFQIYIQNLSSMLDSYILDPRADETILDLCAAPGSKTSHIASLTKNKARLFVVEPDFKRMARLKKNCRDYDVEVEQFIQGWGDMLLNNHSELVGFFDKVLVDAPCSNENTIKLYDKKSLSHWNPKKIKHLTKIQKKLILSGFDALKPGGQMVYSTCTYSFEENEEVVDYLLQNRKNAKVLQISNSVLKNVPQYKNGLVCFKNKIVSAEIQNSIRIIPNNAWSTFYASLVGKRR